MPRQEHGYSLRNARADQAARGGAPTVVQEAVAHPGARIAARMSVAICASTPPLANGEVYSVSTAAAALKQVTFFGAITDSPIDWVRFSSANADAFVNIDNLSFGTASVPEPGSMLLMGLGLVGVARRLRRRSA